ncbi:MAG: hypothetical protein DMF61_19455 [Blastocatellia bacterium AA13]|nr:MAG: hypothetical protein DMF61_19455 [Blastocatellia bacterium AA13]
MNRDASNFLPVIMLGFIAFVILVYILRKILVNVGAREIAIKERRYFGRRMPPGRVVATEGEVGIQADVLKPGLHVIKYPFERVVRKVPLIEIRTDEIGVVEAVDGDPLPPGRVFAPDRAQNAHNNFQDPIAFIKRGGVKGIQLRTLPPGLWPIHPYLFRLSISKVTMIPPGKIGVVTTADGAPLDAGRLLGKAAPGHLNFQDAEQFISGGGQKGSQVEILTPGTYRILTDSIPIDASQGERKPGLFTVRLYEATVIGENQVALVEAVDGSPLNPRDYVAATLDGHDNFQDGHEFIARGGQRGPAAEAAKRLDKLGEDDRTMKEIEEEIMSTDPADRRLDEGAHEAYVVPDGYRGIQETVVGPGRYYVNTLAITPIIIPTTNQTVEWTSGEVANTFNPFEVISKDGFSMQLEVRVVFRVKPEDAPFMVAKIGSIDRLIQNVMHPLIDSIFRNQASESSAMAYLQNRHEEQERAEARVRAHLLKYHVDVVNVLICHIHLPEELMKTQTEKILAEQRQNMFNAQREAEQKRIELEKTRAHADNQRDLMAATVGVEIAGKRAEQRKAEGDGEAHYILATGKAEAEKVRLMGEAQGVAYREQVAALGAQGVSVIETLRVIGEKNVRITPDVLASGGGSGDGTGGLGTLLLLNLFREKITGSPTSDNGSMLAGK